MESQGLIQEVVVLKKITFAVVFIILGISVYLVVIFDINNYKSELEDIISKKSNTEFRISGDLELDLGSNTVVTAELLSVRKNDILILESDNFTADVSLSQVLQGKFDINSVSLKDSNLISKELTITIAVPILVRYIVF